MEQAEFQKYIPTLEQKSFSIYPAPQESNNTVWVYKKFVYRDDSPTHITIEDTETHKTYLVPLALVEFANPGILRLIRVVAPSNGSFV
jgi:hypothetical protein